MSPHDNDDEETETERDTEAVQVVFKDLNSIAKQADALAVLQQIARIEKRTFPTSEALPFGPELWRKKANTSVIYAELQQTQAVEEATGKGSKKAKRKATKGKEQEQRGSPAATPAAAPAAIVAYAVFVRTRDTALLHKVCVVESHRGRGLGRQLVQHVVEQRLGLGRSRVVLWVDEARTAARRLYSGSGFAEVERVEDYYGPGRTGIKMERERERACNA